jgi:hypothetical protein
MNENYPWFNGASGRFALGEKEFHCGDCFKVKVAGAWHDVRIEFAVGNWYLVGVPLGASSDPGAHAAALYD